MKSEDDACLVIKLKVIKIDYLQQIETTTHFFPGDHGMLF